MNRRNFMGIGAGVFAMALISPLQLRAENLRKKYAKAFTDSNVKSAIEDLYGTDTIIKNGVKLTAPDIAANGATVPITVSTEKKNVQSIAIFVDSNPASLVALFEVPKRAIPKYSIRMKMRKTGTITVVAKANGKLYKTTKLVKVTIGGCGG